MLFSSLRSRLLYIFGENYANEQKKSVIFRSLCAYFLLSVSSADRIERTTKKKVDAVRGFSTIRRILLDRETRR